MIASDRHSLSERAAPIGIETWLGFLVGKQNDILKIAASRGAIGVGFLFVISAGLAREYDQEYLLREPWHLLIPIAASIGLSFILHATFWICTPRGERPPFWQRFRVFLTLFWMTAPMAWLYAIPYERILDAAGSVQANLLTLALVAAWRVLLISRVISVLTNQTFVAVLFVVSAIADVTVQIALQNVSLPLLSIMGGVRLSHADLILANTTLLIQILGTLALFVLIPAALGILIVRRTAHLPGTTLATGGRVSSGLFALAAMSVVIWTGILPFTQREQRLRWEVETELRSGRITQAIEMMSAHPREAFPPHWDPPPRIGYREESPPLLDVMEVLTDGRGQPWVRETYLDKFARGYLGIYRFQILSTSEDARVWSILNRLPERDRLLTEQVRDWHDRTSSTQPATVPFTRQNE